MIEAVKLRKSFGGRPAIRDVTFRLEKGQILGFLGPNGAGKTTTMRILTCYMPPDGGSARVDGLDVFRDSMEVRRRMGYLPENPPLYREMLVRDYLAFVARIRGVGRRSRKAAVAGAVERCGLGEVRGRLIGNLSKGFRQRVGLAQALIHDPPVLILDEPTVGLDPQQIIEIRSLIRSLGGDHTVILSTHILSEVAVTCTRVAIISYGAIVREGSLEGLAVGEGGEQIRVRVARNSPAVRQALEKIPWAGAVSEEDGRGSYLLEVSREEIAREEIARMAVEKGWGLLELTPVTRSLEDIYLEATRRLDEGPSDAGRGRKTAAAAGGLP